MMLRMVLNLKKYRGLFFLLVFKKFFLLISGIETSILRDAAYVEEPGLRGGTLVECLRESLHSSLLIICD